MTKPCIRFANRALRIPSTSTTSPPGSGATGSPSTAWTGFRTSRGPAAHGASMTTPWPRVVRKTLEEKPRDATHWSTRSMARATGYAPSTIHRIWQAFSLQPHRSETLKLSADPYFVDKVRDIVGLYVDPPQHSMVLCVDEKSQVQALDRT